MTRSNPPVALAAAGTATFLTMLDATAVSIAAPRLTEDLGASLDELMWVFNAYVLVLAVTLITGGRLGDLLGARRTFLTGLAIFTVASGLVWFAAAPLALIVLRAVQGLGAALLMPQAIVIVGMVYPRERLGAAFGVLSSLAGVASVLGPTVGGVLVTTLGWKWIFLVNVPAGVLGAVLTLAGVPRDVPPGRRRLDLRGVLLCFSGLFLVSYGLIEGQRYDWGRIGSFVSVPLVIAAGLVLLAAFGVSQRGRPHALVPPSLLRDRAFVMTNLVAGFTAFALLGFYLPLTLYLQFARGMPADRAGLALAAMPLVSMVTALVAGRLVDRIGGKRVLMAGLAAFTAGLAATALVAGSGTSAWALQPGLLVIGLGTGLTFPPMTTLAMRDVPHGAAGAAAGVFNSTRHLGNVMSAAAVGALLQNRIAAALPREGGGRWRAAIEAADLDGRSRTYTEALRPTLLLSVALLAAALACAAALPPGRRERAAPELARRA
ncbi:MFS transporter [Actinomadura terrae]|uniref:MFS transporter n=1 Tax=Actinomadura terrae TaxID=604353 RepID=UPI001FA71229|nr:MFS transporter [Actinomadura terrae]